MIDEPYLKNGLFMKEKLPFIGFSGVIVDHDRGKLSYGIQNNYLLASLVQIYV